VTWSLSVGLIILAGLLVGTGPEKLTDQRGRIARVRTGGKTMNSQLRQDPAWVIGVRWFARATSVFSIGLLLLFIIGEGSGPGAVAGRQWIGLLFFPFGVAAGMLVAWKREAPGGLLSIGSLTCFYVVYGFILSGRLPGGWAFAAFSSPALLFLLTWLLEKTKKDRNGDIHKRRIVAH
jgi:hypothetical protein